MKSLAARLRYEVRHFALAREGNVAMFFALAMFPVIGMMGAAVDYSRANAVKAELQSALDATALMVSKNAPNVTKDELQKQAQAYFNALFKNSEGYSTVITATYNADASTVKLDGTTKVKSDFIHLMGEKFANIPVNGMSSATWGSSRLRVALALDNTGSMASSNKMTALKTAAKNLLTRLQSAAKNPGDVYVSIVPFAKVVNVGSSNYNAPWVDFKDHGSWDGWDSENGDDVSTTTCSGGSGKKKKCKTSKTWVPDDHKTWNGCITDRDQDYDVTNHAPDVKKQETLFPAEPDKDTACPASILPLTYDWTALKNKIDSMKPDGNTNVGIGMAWGWHALTQGAPLFAPPEDPKYKYNKVLILLTDGENTENRFTKKQSDIDARTKLACEKAKKEDITIYTVLVIEGTQSLLQQCASDSKKYFFLQSANGLVAAFDQIGTELTSLRVSK